MDKDCRWRDDIQRYIKILQEGAYEQAPDLLIADLDEHQRSIYDIIKRQERDYVTGPIRAMLLSPDFAEKAQMMGVFLRYKNAIGMRLSELATLVVARHWTCQYVWHLHAARGVKEGLSSEAVEAIRTRAKPNFTRDDEAVVYAFAQEMMRDHRVSTATYDRAVKIFGAPGVAEMIGLLGYIALLSMTINGFELDLPEGTPLPLGA